MYFWCICGEEVDLHVLLFCHLEAPPDIAILKNTYYPVFLGILWGKLTLQLTNILLSCSLYCFARVCCCSKHSLNFSCRLSFLAEGSSTLPGYSVSFWDMPIHKWTPEQETPIHELFFHHVIIAMIEKKKERKTKWSKEMQLLLIVLIFTFILSLTVECFSGRLGYFILLGHQPKDV